MAIHPTAILDDSVVLGDGVEIGPYCVIGPNVSIGDRVRLKPHVVISENTQIGPDCILSSNVVLGEPPQHTAYQGEPTTLIVGAGNIIREYVTFHRGTAAGGGVTRIGDHGFFMAGSHVAHDCQIGDHIVLANNTHIGGHCVVGDYAFLGGGCAIHQFSRLGAYSFLAGGAIVDRDVIPYASAMGNHAKLVGLNLIGMKRRKIDRQSIHQIRGAFQDLFDGPGTFKERVEQVRATYGVATEVKRILSFIDEDARRPLMTTQR